MTKKPIFVYINQNGFVAKNTFGELTLASDWGVAHPFESAEEVRIATEEVFRDLIAVVGWVGLEVSTQV